MEGVLRNGILMNPEEEDIDKLPEIKAQLCALTICVIQFWVGQQRAAHKCTGNKRIPPHRPLRIRDQVCFHLQGTIHATGRIACFSPSYIHIRTPGQEALI
jgi:hypothetical protein